MIFVSKNNVYFGINITAVFRAAVTIWNREPINIHYYFHMSAVKTNQRCFCMQAMDSY